MAQMVPVQGAPPPETTLLKEIQGRFEVPGLALPRPRLPDLPVAARAMPQGT